MPVLTAARRLVVAAAIAVAAVAPAAQAQGYFGLGGGGAFPVGQAGRQLAIGYNALGFIGFGAPDIPLGVRFDGMYNHFQYKHATNASETLWTGNANLVAPLSQGPLVPYLIGGVGYYARNTSFANSNTGAFGVNGGLGVRTWGASRFGIFLEARYHYAFTRNPGQAIVPITVGVIF
ncbi:MAG TPA: outer membrane beta-barrel protein [Gemmatimonadaceae bacterium]|jgi:hypothetical protein|nr:outer membrane beta-barrel protein [Gemmatimonadaceae bacterium]